jgi:hypothetical protein
MVAPDGSKEGWDDSAEGDSRRQHYTVWLVQRVQDDPWGSLDWVELQYGDENNAPSVVTASSDRGRRAQSSD